MLYHLETFAMKELNQPYSEVQLMPLVELFRYSEIIQESLKEMETKMNEAKSNMNVGMNKFKVR